MLLIQEELVQQELQQNVFKYGLSASWYVIAGGIGFILVSFIAPYFRRAQANTVPEIISKRYGKASHIFTAFTSILALFMATGAQIIATASIINVVTGFNFKTAAIVSTIVVIVYTMFGGFKSVTAANLMHVLFITIGMAIAMFIMVNNEAVGGFQALFEKAKNIHDVDGNDMNFLSMTKIGATTILGYIAMYFMTFPTGQEIVQTYCSAKDGKSAKNRFCTCRTCISSLCNSSCNYRSFSLCLYRWIYIRRSSKKCLSSSNYNICSTSCSRNCFSSNSSSYNVVVLLEI